MPKPSKSTKRVSTEAKPSEVPKGQNPPDEEKPESPSVKQDLSALRRERDFLLAKLQERNEYLTQLKAKRIATEERCVMQWELLQGMEVALEEERQLRQRREKDLQRCKQLVKAKAKKVQENLEEQANFKNQLNTKLRLNTKLAGKLQTQVAELSEQVSTLKTSVQPVESAVQTESLPEPMLENSDKVTEDSALDTKVSEPELGSEQPAVPQPSKKRRRRKNKKAKKIRALEEPETSEPVSTPLADQETLDNKSLDQEKTEETEPPAKESFPEETVMESTENVVGETSVQVQDSDPVFASEQLTTEPSRKRKRFLELDTQEFPPTKNQRTCKKVIIRTRLAKRRAVVKARLETTEDKAALGLPWSFLDETDPVSPPQSQQESVPETESDTISDQETSQDFEEPSDQNSEEIKSSEVSDESISSELLGEESDCSSQADLPKKPKISLWRRFKKALTPARWRKHKSDTPVVIQDHRSTDPAEADEHLLQSTSVDDPDSESSLLSSSTDSGLTEEEMSAEQETETSDDEEETSDNTDDESSKNSGGQKPSVWRRFKKAFTPAGKRQYKERMEN